MLISSFIKELITRVTDDQIFDRSAQLAYYFLLSLFPFLLLTVTLLGFLPFSSQDVLNMVWPYTPPSAYNLIKDNLKIILDERQNGILSFSLISTFYLASLGFQSIIRILDQAYQVKRERAVWKTVTWGFFLMLEILIGLLISLFLPVFGKLIGEAVFRLLGITNWFQQYWNWIRWLISTFVLFLVFVSLYIFVPNTRVTFRQALPGAIFATLGWQLSSLGFAYYVTFNNYSLLYGNLGGIIVLVGWFYLSAMILILGGYVNAALRKIRSNQTNT